MAAITQDLRQQILGRIRKHLDASPLVRDPVRSAPPSEEVQKSARRNIGAGRSPLQVFKEELTLVGGVVKEIRSDEEMYSSLGETCRNENFQSVVLSREPIMEELRLETELGRHLSGTSVATMDEGNLVGQLKDVEVGITACEFLVAETGTVILRSSSRAPRVLSLLPRVHIVIAREKQLLPTLASYFEKLHSTGEVQIPSSCLTLVTGSSRTADIEKVLVKGVHGPRELYVFLILNSV